MFITLDRCINESNNVYCYFLPAVANFYKRFGWCYEKDIYLAHIRKSKEKVINFGIGLLFNHFYNGN